MTRDGIIKDVSETKRVLMSGDFTHKQSEMLIGFVNEQIKDYCHSKVDQRIFENWLKDELEFRFNSLTTIFHTKEDQRIFERKINEQFDSLKTIFHSKEDQRIFEKKLDEKFKHFEKKSEDRFLQVMEMIKTQSLAINELSKKMDKIDEKYSLS
jgi:hypothetical protein